MKVLFLSSVLEEGPSTQNKLPEGINYLKQASSVREQTVQVWNTEEEQAILWGQFYASSSFC
jgi:hypothetical protein